MTRDLEYIRAIEKYGSMTKAAEKIYISQSALSQYIKRIEESLGVDIFDRSKKPLSLTDAGVFYKNSLEEIDLIKEETREKIEALSKLQIGKINIGSTDYQTYYFLSDALRVFDKKFPGIKVNLIEEKTDDLNKLALEGACDFVITYETSSYEDLEYVELYEEEVFIAVSKESPLADFKKERAIGEIPASKLLGERMINAKKGQNLRLQYHELDRLTGGSLRSVLETESIFIARKFVEEGLGIALLPEAMAREDGDKIVYLRLKEGLSSRTAVVNFSKKHRPKRAARIFIDMLKDAKLKEG